MIAKYVVLSNIISVVSDSILRICIQEPLMILKKIIALLHTLSARAVALDTSKTFDTVWHASLLHKRRSYGISGQIFGLISSFLSNRQLRVVLDGKSLQEYLVNAGVPQGSILGLTLLSFIYTFLSVTLLSLLMILPSTLNMIWHLNCGNNYN